MRSITPINVRKIQNSTFRTLIIRFLTIMLGYQCRKYHLCDSGVHFDGSVFKLEFDITKSDRLNIKIANIRKVLLCHNDCSAICRRYLHGVQLSVFEFQHAYMKIAQMSYSDHEKLLISQPRCTALTVGTCLPFGLCKETVSGLSKTVEIPTGHHANPQYVVNYPEFSGVEISQPIFRSTDHRTGHPSKQEAILIIYPLIVIQPPS